MNAIPNLDGMTPDELETWTTEYNHTQRIGRKQAYRLIGDRRPNYTIIARNIACYGINKLTAMRCRTRGDIQTAFTYERICDQIYQRLPADLRW